MTAVNFPPGPLHWSANSLPAEQPVDPTLERILRSIKNAMNKLETTIWNPLKEGVKAIKCTLKATALIYSPLTDKVAKIIAYLGLLSGIKFMFQCSNFIDDIDDLQKCNKVGDIEGVIWSAIDLIFFPLEGASSVLSFGETLSKLIKLPWPALFSLVAVPLTAVIICYDTLRSIIKLIYLSVYLMKMPTAITSEDPTELKKYIKKMIGAEKEEKEAIERRVINKYALNNEIPALDDNINLPPSSNKTTYSEPNDPLTPLRDDWLAKRIDHEIKREIKLLKNRKISKLKRIDKKIVNIMKNLKPKLSKNPRDLELSQKSLADMRFIIIGKIIQQSVGATLNITEGTLYVAAMILPVSLWIPLIFSTGKLGFSLSKSCYNKYIMPQMLNMPEQIQA